MGLGLGLGLGSGLGRLGVEAHREELRLGHDVRDYARLVEHPPREQAVGQLEGLLGERRGGGAVGGGDAAEGGAEAEALHDGVAAEVRLDSWEVPHLFKFLQAHGNVADEEMFRVFNMGIGYVLIVRPTFADAVLRKLQRFGEDPVKLGRIVRGKGEVKLK